MRRDRTSFLIEWLNSSTRKPLVIRGARQVGKTWLVRDLASLSERQLIDSPYAKKFKVKTFHD